MATTDEIILTQLTNQLQSAYRKCKTTIYYDNYSTIPRLEFANFEKNPQIFDIEYKINQFFPELAKIILDEEEFDDLIDFICDNIDVIAFPKHVDESNKKDNEVIRNFHLKNFNMDKLHYFIDLPIIGHILGVLWILRCGYLLDDKLYKNCYGNRLNNYLLDKLKNKRSDYYVNNDCSDFSPFLFIPYYQNYQSWRDNGLESVNNLLDDKKNAIMISLDLKEYFHRSLIDFDELKKDLMDTRNYVNGKLNYSNTSSEEEVNVKIDERLTNFIEKVFYAYSNKFNRKYSTKSLDNKKIFTNKYPMIPVGFSPSLIISNWNLQGFDQAIVENVRPHYYGRYVDDILIVLGSHEKSESHGLQQIEEKTFDELIERYLTDKNHPKTHIFKKQKRRTENIYRIFNQSFKNAEGNKITYHYEGLEIQDSKLKTYFFSHKYSNAMIENFKNEIRKNSSEFRLMHDLESIKQDFKENLYKINYKESINKIRDINNVEVNKFEISKILSRLIWISSDSTDNIDDEIIKNMIDAFKGKIFDYLTLWDKLFTLLLINNKYGYLRDLIRYIQKNIGNITYSSIKENSYKYEIKNVKDEEIVKTSLMKYLYYTLSRVFSLKYNLAVKKIIEDIEFDFNDDLEINFANQISNCLYSSMQNTSLMKYPLQNLSNIFDDFDETTEFDLINQKNGCRGLFNGFCYPRFIKLHECILHIINNELFCEKEDFARLKESLKSLNEEYLDEDFIELFLGKHFGEDYLEKAFNFYQEKNFKREENMYKDHITRECELECANGKHCPFKIYGETQFKDINVIKIKGNRKNKIKVGLLNANVDLNDFEKRILGKPNLSSQRFDKIKLLINEAIRKNVDLLIIPEMYIPYEWIENIVKISKDHQMAIIFGIGPIEHQGEMGNYIMMAMPFIFNDKYHECALMYRPKNHYSPHEMNQFEKYEKKINGDRDIAKYYMCIWKGIHIVPYCSYEIASVDDRSIFKSCCDIVTVSECNKDTKYINGIAESLSRDLFCYCIKSNVTAYGGSCIIQPTSDKYLINVKGGEDDYIVTQDLDIKKLRKNAIKSDKIKDSSNFESKPPGFWKNNVKERY